MAKSSNPISNKRGPVQTIYFTTAGIEALEALRLDISDYLRLVTDNKSEAVDLLVQLIHFGFQDPKFRDSLVEMYHEYKNKAIEK